MPQLALSIRSNIHPGTSSHRSDACPETLQRKTAASPFSITSWMWTCRPVQGCQGYKEAHVQHRSCGRSVVELFNTERPHEALAMKCPAELYSASARHYHGLPELDYPFHDRDILVTACGRICLHRKRINISTVLAGQRLGIREVDEGIWLVLSLIHI